MLLHVKGSTKQKYAASVKNLCLPCPCVKVRTLQHSDRLSCCVFTMAVGGTG